MKAETIAPPLPRSVAEAGTGHEVHAREPSLWQGVAAVCARDLRLALRRRVDALSGLVFFVLVASLFPLGVGADAALLARLGPGVVWVAALLASMLSLSRLFADDHRDGCLEGLLLSPHPLALLVLSKALAHWVASGGLLVLAAPVLALQYGLSPSACGVLVLTLLMGTPVLSLLGAIGAALTLGLRNGGVLVSLLVLPLCVPVLVFGAGAVDAHQAGLGAGGHLSLLGALLLLVLPTAPWAAAAALRIAYD